MKLRVKFHQEGTNEPGGDAEPSNFWSWSIPALISLHRHISFKGCRRVTRQSNLAKGSSSELSVW